MCIHVHSSQYPQIEHHFTGNADACFAEIVHHFFVENICWRDVGDICARSGFMDLADAATRPVSAESVLISFISLQKKLGCFNPLIVVSVSKNNAKCK